METQEGAPVILDQVAAESVKTEEQHAAITSSVLPSPESGTEVRQERTEDKSVPLDSSPVRAAESSSAPVSKGELETASNDGAFTSSAPLLGGSVPDECTGNIREGSVEGKTEPKSAVSSFPSTNPAGDTESGKAKGHDHDSSTSNTMRPICVAEVAEIEETEAESDLLHPIDTFSFEGAAQVACSSTVPTVQSVLAVVFRCAAQESVESNKDGENASITVRPLPAAIGAESAETTSNEMTQIETGERRIPPKEEPEVEEIAEGGETKPLISRSSSSEPETGGSFEPSSASSGKQKTDERAGREISRQDNCNPSPSPQRRHYVVLSIAVLSSIYGLTLYLMAELGGSSEVLRPIGASTFFLSLAVVFITGTYISYLGYNPELPVISTYEMMGDVDSVMAINRITNPESYCNEEDNVSRSRTSRTSSEKGHREVQFSDGPGSTGSLQTETKMCLPGEPGPSGLAHTAEGLETGLDEVVEKISVPKKDGSTDSGANMSSCDEQELPSNGSVLTGTTQSSTCSTAEQTSDSQSSDEYHVSDTSAKKLLINE